MSLLAFIEAAAVGSLAAIVVIYSLQTRVMYPKWAIAAADKPWVLLVLGLLSALTYEHSPRVSALLLIAVASLWLDIAVLAQPQHAKTIM